MLNAGMTPDPGGFWRAVPEGAADEYASSDPYGVEQNMEGPFQQMRWSGTLRALTSTGTVAGPVLDVGCGEGHLTRRVADRFPAAELWGVDLSTIAIRAAATRIPAERLVVASALEMPFLPSRFKGAIVNNLWEHVTDPVALAREIARVLEPGGWIILSTPNRLRLGAIGYGVRGRQAPLMSHLHITEYTAGQVDDQLRAAGLVPERTFGLGLGARTALQRAASAVLGPVAARMPDWRTVDPTLFVVARRPAA